MDQEKVNNFMQAVLDQFIKDNETDYYKALRDQIIGLPVEYRIYWDEKENKVKMEYPVNEIR